MATLKFIPTVTASSGPKVYSLEEIPDEVKNDVEEAYELLKKQNGRLAVEFPSVGELNLYMAHVKSYCELRPAGAIRFRKSPTKNLKPTQMEFRITDVETPNETTTREVREATDAVKAAANK